MNMFPWMYVVIKICQVILNKNDEIKINTGVNRFPTSTVEPRQFRHPAIGTPQQSGLGFSGTQPRESNGKNRRK